MLSNIQALRAFAALNVMFVHIFMSSEDYQLPLNLLAVFRDWGANGVDIFFVISGFIMFYIQHQKKRTPFAFFKDRVFRIVPLYWSLTLGLAAVMILAPSIFRKLSLSSEWLIQSLTFTANVVHEINPIIFAGWTLEYEMLFYIIFAISLFASSQTLSFLITVTLIFIASQITHLIVFEFILGMCVCWIYIHNRQCSQNVALVSFFLGVMLLIPSIGIPDLDTWIRSKEIHRVIVWGIPAALILYGAVNLKQTSNGLLIALGNASYSIYLIQILTIPAFYKVLGAMKVSSINPDIAGILCFIFTAFAGYVLHIGYEKPIANLLKRWNH